MWFIVGMVVGAGMSGQDARGIPLGDIPFRCFVALDAGDAAYMECRRLSLAAQMWAQYSNTPKEYTGAKPGDFKQWLNDALTLELKGLRAAEQASKAKQ